MDEIHAKLNFFHSSTSSLVEASCKLDYDDGVDGGSTPITAGRLSLPRGSRLVSPPPVNMEEKACESTLGQLVLIARNAHYAAALSVACPSGLPTLPSPEIAML